MVDIILASQSPRRHELIKLLGLSVERAVADIDEEQVDIPDLTENVRMRARLKAEAIVRQQPMAHFILGADTTVALGDTMLNKPQDTADAVRMLMMLREKTHLVHTAMVLIEVDSGRRLTAVHSAEVTMRAYSDAEIAAYVATGDPMDKAGAYAIQAPQFKPVSALRGCYLGVMGLSVCQLETVFAKVGFATNVDRTAVLNAHLGYLPCPFH